MWIKAHCLACADVAVGERDQAVAPSVRKRRGFERDALAVDAERIMNDDASPMAPSIRSAFAASGSSKNEMSASTDIQASSGIATWLNLPRIDWLPMTRMFGSPVIRHADRRMWAN
jgi:hypothetical protein